MLILEGGCNEEHKVSVKTSKEVSKVLKKLNINYNVIKVNPKTFHKEISKYSNEHICFNALHGTFGEDGKIQKILKSKKFKVTHSNYTSSLNCFNKLRSKRIAINSRILTPKYKIVTCKNINASFLKSMKLKFEKFIIKPVSSGSSHGLKIIKTIKDLNDFFLELNNFKKQFNHNEEFLCEKFISGKELTVSNFQEGLLLKSIEVTEIVSLNKTYDYQAKYSKGFSKHFLPARISKKNHQKCLNLAMKIHNIFNCNTLSRVDFILNEKQNKIYFLEINSQPGMTRLSLVPEQASFKKIKFEDIIMMLIKNAR